MLAEPSDHTWPVGWDLRVRTRMGGFVVHWGVACCVELRLQTSTGEGELDLSRPTPLSSLGEKRDLLGVLCKKLQPTSSNYLARSLLCLFRLGVGILVLGGGIQDRKVGSTWERPLIATCRQVRRIHQERLQGPVFFFVWARGIARDVVDGRRRIQSDCGAWGRPVI